MSTTRDENSRASAYISSDKPLFNKPRNIDRKYFTKDARPRRDQDLLGPEGSLSSRIPTRINSPPKSTITLKSAWEKALKEEEEAFSSANRTIENAVRDGSPSPAPRTRDRVRESQHEKDERRIRRLKESIPATLGSPLAQNGAESTDHIPEDSNTTTSTYGSNSDVSLSGSWTGVGEEITDEGLERRMREHENNQKRTVAALRTQKGLFAKGTVSTRVNETAQTLARRSSASSIESEPGIRIPNTWGRKARPTSGWMSRIISPESSDEVQRHPLRAQSEGSVDWMEAAAKVPLPSIEDSSVTQEPTPPHSRPSSAQPITKSTENSQTWDADLEFTTQSLQISTSPQLKIRNTKLDEIRLREIESLSKRAVATSRLEEIRERNSEERSVSPEALRRISKENLSGGRISENAAHGDSSHGPSQSELRRAVDKDALNKTALTDQSGERRDSLSGRDSNVGAPPVIPQLELVEEKALERDIDKEGLNKTFEAESLPAVGKQGYLYEKTILEEEGETIPGTPITVFAGIVERRKDLRPGHKREDSWDTLRKLAKVASVSPSPVSIKTEERLPGEPTRNSEKVIVTVEKPPEEATKIRERPISVSNSKRNSRASSPPKSDVDPEERIAAEASLFELPPADNKSERNSVFYPSPESDGDVEETPRPKPDPLSLPTPVVMGAYIDTPAPRGRISKVNRSPSPPSDVDDALHDEVSRLAMRDYIRETNSRSLTKDRFRGRSLNNRPGPLSSHPTRQSSKSSSRPLSRPPLINTANPASVGDDLRKLRREAQIEDSTLDDFDELLTAEADGLDPNSTTIIDLPIELENDERGQSISEKERDRRQEMLAYERMNKTVKSSLRNIRDAKRGIERIEDQVNSTPAAIPHAHEHQNCAVCASQTSFYHLTVPIPRLWYRDSAKWAGIRFTWLGLILALFLAWFVSESITCEYICHPKYAIRNEWHPSDPFWGGALPTLVDRSTGGMLKVSLRSAWRLLMWLWRAWTGGEGGRDWFPSWSTGLRPRAPGAAVPPQSAAGWSEGSMFEDETI